MVRRSYGIDDAWLIFFDEVSDDLRAERAANVLRRYGGMLLGLAVLVLIAVGGQQGWAWYQGQQNARAATAYIALNNKITAAGPSITNDQRVADAKALEDFAATASTGYRDLAKLRAAGLFADAGADRRRRSALERCLG